jgi:hypothetical protein
MITIGLPACVVELWLRAKLLFNPTEKADVIVGASDIFFNNIDIDYAKDSNSYFFNALYHILYLFFI